VSKQVRIYPVEHSGIGWRPYIEGVAAVVTDCDPERARELVATGAFTYDPPPDAAEPEGAAPADPATPTED
jgi:hypothetical protein